MGRKLTPASLSYGLQASRRSFVQQNRKWHCHPEQVAYAARRNFRSEAWPNGENQGGHSTPVRGLAGISSKSDLPPHRQTYILCDKTVLQIQQGTSDSYEIPPVGGFCRSAPHCTNPRKTACLFFMSAEYRYLCTIRNAPTSTAKTSTRAEKGLHCSHNNYIPHLLRMTVGVGFVVTLSKRGSYLLRLHTAIHLRARRSFAF